MSTRDRSGGTPAATFMLLTLLAGGVTLPLLGAAEAHRTPFVDEEVRTRALESVVPDRPTMTDAIEHYEARSRARPGETFATARLFDAHMLAFRAYGAPTHLDRAERLIERMPEPSRVRLRSTASLALARHDFPAALRASEELRAHRGDEDALYRLFDARWAVGDRVGAGAILELPLDTTSTSYLSRKARFVDGMGDVEPARDLFRRVVDNVEAYAEPAAVRAWALVELGHFELHSGDPAAAVRQYERALDVLPGSPAALEGLASVAYGVDRDLETARDLYRRALEHGAHLDVQPTLADLEEALGNTAEANRLRRDFVHAATSGVRSEMMNRRPLAFLLAESPSMHDEALRLARADLAARQDQGAFDALAWVFFRRGEVQMAWTFAERGLDAGGAPPPTLFRAGLIADAAGHPDRAESLLEEALEGSVELSPSEVAAAEAVVTRIR